MLRRPAGFSSMMIFDWFGASVPKAIVLRAESIQTQPRAFASGPTSISFSAASMQRPAIRSLPGAPTQRRGGGSGAVSGDAAEEIMSRIAAVIIMAFSLLIDIETDSAAFRHGP
jgi:hypothetical protein